MTYGTQYVILKTSTAVLQLPALEVKMIISFFRARYEISFACVDSLLTCKHGAKRRNDFPLLVLPLSGESENPEACLAGKNKNRGCIK